MNKIFIFIVLLSLYVKCINAQTDSQISPSDLDTPIENNDAQILELIAIFNDAISAPTEYNAYVTPFINEESFPKNQNLSQEEFDNKLKQWINANPLIIEKFIKARQEAHYKLYGPRKSN